MRFAKKEQRGQWSVGLLGTGSGAGFFCTLRSSGSLFCYAIQGKQLQKCPYLAANGVAPGGVVSCSMGGSATMTPVNWHRAAMHIAAVCTVERRA